MALHLDRVSKTYFRNGRPITALDNVSIEVETGELVAILGGRGSGKTSLLRVAAALERPDSGHIELDGRRLDRLSNAELTRIRRTSVGCVWSQPVPVGRANVLEVVALPLRLQSGDGQSALVDARRTLEAVGIDHYRGAQLAELSDGERQLVAIAQALVAKPRLLLLDQPAANLELAEEKNVLRSLSTLATESKVAIVMTARSATETVAATRIGSMSAGRLIYSGEPREAEVLPFGRGRSSSSGDRGADA